MNDDFIRRALWATAFMNLGAGLIFAFPGSMLGQVAGLPADTPALYRGTVALFVILFGGTYAWLARQLHINRPMVGLGAIGKAAFFTLTAGLWLFDAVPARLVLVAAGDIVFAGLFFRWLLAPASANTGR